MGPQLFIRIHDSYGVAVVHGPEATAATRAVASVDRKYSVDGGGWLVPLDLVADVEAWGHWNRLLVVVYRPKAKGAA